MPGATDAYHNSLIITATCIIITNSYALSLFMRHRSLLTKTNYLLLSLALSEFMTGMVNIPLMVHAEKRATMPSKESITFAITADISTVLCASITMITLCGIIVDRYLIIRHPVKYYSLVSEKKIVVFIIVSWVLPFIVSFIRLHWIAPVLSLPLASVRNSTAYAISNNYDTKYYIFGTAIYLGMIAVLFVLFVLMFLAIKQLGRDEREFTTTQRNNAATLRRETKAVILFAVMYLAFIICWTPLVLLRLLVTAFRQHYSGIPSQALHALIIIKYLTSVFNPLLYILYKLDFYQEFKNDVKMLEKICCCDRRRAWGRRGAQQTEVSFYHSAANGDQRVRLIHGNGFHERVNTAEV